MSSAGPELPPHLLAKRKRQAEEEEAAAASNKDARPNSPDAGEKRRRVVGPAPPPAPLDELPSSRPEDDEDSSSDDDFGPAMPPKDAPSVDDEISNATIDVSVATDAQSERTARDEWMMMPPTQDDLAARMDPTKIRARKFNTGPRASGGGGSSSTMWTETPEQKRKRLENQVLGIAETTDERGEGARMKKSRKDEETAQRLREHNAKNRGKSLYEEHRGRKDREEEDDPSKRAFDWEKDMKSGAKVGHAKRKEMVNRSSDFGSRFSGGSYL